MIKMQRYNIFFYNTPCGGDIVAFHLILALFISVNFFSLDIGKQ